MGLLYGDPDELDRLAGALQARAVEVRDRADQQVARADAAEWASVSAQAYRERLVQRRTAAYEVADGLDEAAAGLAAHAEWDRTPRETHLWNVGDPSTEDYAELERRYGPRPDPG